MQISFSPLHYLYLHFVQSQFHHVQCSCDRQRHNVTQSDSSQMSSSSVKTSYQLHFLSSM